MAQCYFYILKGQFKSGKIRYYKGVADDLKKRINQHRKCKNKSKYTYKFHGKFELVYYELYPDKSSAMRRELEVKNYSPGKIKELIKNFEGSLNGFKG